MFLRHATRGKTARHTGTAQWIWVMDRGVPTEEVPAQRFLPGAKNQSNLPAKGCRRGFASKAGWKCTFHYP